MPKYVVVVCLHESREYLVEASSIEEAKDNYADFDYEETVIEESIVEVEKS